MTKKPYKQIVILSGKGGTGKTTIAAAFSSIISNKVIIDCDVDAANMHLILNSDEIERCDFNGGKKAAIDSTRCMSCGLCQSVCRFDAIIDFAVTQINCEGCGFCARICPVEAVTFTDCKSGTYFVNRLPDGSKFYYAKLLPGAGNSGKLVSEIKSNAIKNISPDVRWVIIDGPPGIGCPVNASIASADFAVLVIEPTVSGLHDLKRLAELLSRFHLQSGIIVNKCDLNEQVTNQIFGYAEEKNIPVIGTIPFDLRFVESLIEGKNIVDIHKDIRENIRNIFDLLLFQMKIS